jgi:cyclohexadieny/prephenate dehydrogenase
MRVAVVGLGLVGGSVGAALKAAGHTVTGFDADASVRARALGAGLVDTVADAPEAVGEGAEVVFLAVPVGAMVAVARAVAPGLKPGTVVSDTGSTKARLVAELPAALPEGVAYVPGHPIAGSDRSGPDAARADLFQGRVTVLCAEGPLADRVAGLWRDAGSRVVYLPAADHDSALSRTSHLPHLVSFALSKALECAEPDLAGDGLKDMLRLAGSDPVMWRDVFVSNRDAVLDALGVFEAALAELRRLVDEGDPEAILAWLEAARRA